MVLLFHCTHFGQPTVQTIKMAIRHVDLKKFILSNNNFGHLGSDPSSIEPDGHPFILRNCTFLGIRTVTVGR